MARPKVKGECKRISLEFELPLVIQLTEAADKKGQSLTEYCKRGLTEILKKESDQAP